ncbi:MAG: hypothetical protein HQL99_08445 [Magnetococcales bacterium]|nr:hypothetical protein [Magnetococcales bacterium]
MGLFGVLILLMALVLVPVPLLGGYLTVLPGFLAFFVGRSGAPAALVAVGVNAVHVLFWSDFIRFNATTGLRDGVYLPTVIYVGLVMLQVASGLVIGWRHYFGREGWVSDSGSSSSRGAR